MHVSTTRRASSPKVAPDAELLAQDGAETAVALRQEVEGHHARAGGEEAAPEQAQAQEGGPLLDGQQQAANRGGKGRCHTCRMGKAYKVPLGFRQAVIFRANPNEALKTSSPVRGDSRASSGVSSMHTRQLSMDV